MSTSDEIDEFLEEIESELERKWLEYYEANRVWIVASGLYKVDSYSDKKFSISREFILGVITALEPRLTKLLPYLVKVNADRDTLISKLGLNLDPESMLVQRELEILRSKQAEVVPLLPESTEQNSNSDPDTEYLNQIRQDMNSQHPPS
ncbi:DUF5331 domain-containing protein [Oscillatoria sp. FACHB-1406]|uniref:DUF5331 domain-containing protein n=1 Tax=Oscillatoria sp. FACHB-1406 TaxID=2692846 RepID=UPI0016844B93|nr:DUF5331 domain-containing protein [Oscillatoria sp. FACHB-1406]MBD2577656.1 hypothetical protein [Oscillatoria sp. FACHB-1406]